MDYNLQEPEAERMTDCAEAEHIGTVFCILKKLLNF